MIRASAAQFLRLHPQRHTDAVFEPTVFSSIDELEARKKQLQYQLQLSAGLYPWPQKTPLNVKFEEVGEYDGYSIQKVMFETFPGLWSTGNLYLPHPLPQKAPAILNVIGHWEEQRLTRMHTADYPQQLANFARIGFVCLVTDMIGMVDSRQLTHYYGQKEKELWCSNGLGVQLWNNIRALDLLEQLPYVDRDNIGVTGASGGGSQTLFLSLMDDRIKAAAPINMISLHMQGGCQCENAPGLRKDTNNTEMCAMLAPRPLFLAGSTGDWTKNLLTDELPMLQDAYALYGASDKVEHFYQDAEHQYNAKTRHHVYRFFARHLMGKELEWEEQPIETKDLLALTWFRNNGKAQGFADDEAFFAYHKQQRRLAVAGLSRTQRQKMLAWTVNAKEREFKIKMQQNACDSDIKEFHIKAGDDIELQADLYAPQNWDGSKLCLMLTDHTDATVIKPLREQLAAQNTAMLVGSVFLAEATDEQRMIGKDENDPYYTTFHDTPDACRAQDADILIKAASTLCEELTVRADGICARATACALALNDTVKSAALEAAALQLDDDTVYYREFFIPGICALGGLDGCLQLAAAEITYF